MSLWKPLHLLSFYLLISKYKCQQVDIGDNNNDEGDDEDDDDSEYDDDDSCSFISGQGCLNGICKYCAMCIPSNCILGTPYSTGNNDGSTCSVLDEQDNGYDFYNYCLSSGDQYVNDDTSRGCPTSTVCYQYRHSNSSHVWDNLTCAQDSCLLINHDGSPPPVPNTDNINITVSGPNNSHPKSNRYHYNELDIKSGSAASIALTTSCIILALCFVALLTRCFCRKWKSKITLFFLNSSSNNSSIHHSISPPPSFRSNILYSPHIMMIAANSTETLPDYDQNLPPKYEHAIVTQIRGFPSSSSSATEEEALWIPVYVSPLPTLRPPNDTARSNNGFNWVPSHQDWATIQHEQ